MEWLRVERMWLWLGLAGVVVVGAKLWAFTKWRDVQREVDESDATQREAAECEVSSVQ